MKKNINEKRYPDIEKAVAFKIAFAPVICTYGSVGWDEIEEVVCEECGQTVQFADFLAPKSECKMDAAILDICHYGFSIEVHDLLIDNFDITEQDFRPIRNKTGDIVFYQITPQHIMLPIESANEYRRIGPCPKCGAYQYREKEYKNEAGWEYGYITKEALDDLHDLNETYEKFNVFIPRWIVSRRVYDFLMERYPRMIFQPLYLREQTRQD